MNKNDFKNPLIQSGAVLIIVFFLIAIVANSDAQGIVGSVSALFSGLISGILFLIALILAIIISIAIIIGLFIAAVSIHSVDKARDLFQQLKDSIKSIYGKITGFASGHGRSAAAKLSAAAVPAQATATSHEFEQKFSRLTGQINALQATVGSLQAKMDETAGQLADLLEQASQWQSHDHHQEMEAVEQTQTKLAGQVEDLASALAAAGAKHAELEAAFVAQQQQTASELEALYEKTSIPDVVSGILSYIDLPEDRETLNKKAEEAVSRGMTYGQIDDFFKSVLPPNVYKLLGDHPRLTKDFIRSVKKKFE